MNITVYLPHVSTRGCCSSIQGYRQAFEADLRLKGCIFLVFIHAVVSFSKADGGKTHIL